MTTIYTVNTAGTVGRARTKLLVTDSAMTHVLQDLMGEEWQVAYPLTQITGCFELILITHCEISRSSVPKKKVFERWVRETVTPRLTSREAPIIRI